MKNLLAVLFVITFLLGCGGGEDKILPDPERIKLNLALGNPSGAKEDRNAETNYLIQLPQYSLSYNRTRGLPNWVSWHLSDDWLGSAERQDMFQAYEALPTGWYQVQVSDYAFSKNGFDRGHNCPSADRTLNEADNQATFYMTNMIPQAPMHNQGVWEKLESYCRRLAREGNELYIITGNYGVGGTGNEGYREKLADGKVTVPRHLWKVILVLPKGENDVDRMDEDTRVIAISIENKNSLGDENWSKYRVSVNEIEAATGYDFFSVLPNSVEAVMESKVDVEKIF